MSLAGRSVPDFWLAVLALYPLAAIGLWRLETFAPVWEAGSPPPINLLPMLCVALIAGWRFGGTIVQPTRSAIVDVLAQDHVRTARAKGFGERSVLVQHVLRYALPPFLMSVRGSLPMLLGSVLMVELALGVPGIGWVAFESIDRLDFPMIRGVLLAVALTVIGANLMVDMAVAILDLWILTCEEDVRRSSHRVR